LICRWIPCVRPTLCNGSLRLCSSTSDKGASKCDKENAVNADKEPEEPTTCCMSGCANCVWIEYAEVMVVRYKDGGHRARKAIESIKDPMMKAFLTMELKSIGEKK